MGEKNVKLTSATTSNRFGQIHNFELENFLRTVDAMCSQLRGVSIHHGTSYHRHHCEKRIIYGPFVSEFYLCQDESE